MNPLPAQALLPVLTHTLDNLEPARPDANRQQVLDDLAAWIGERLQDGHPDPIGVMFICTHNSRRSQMAQAWFAALAHRQGLGRLRSFSGGTEETAFNIRAVRALERAGFGLTASEENPSNPRFKVRFSDGAEPLRMHSKTFDHPENPSRGFAAVMVCSDADTACPMVPGAAARFALPFTDPKAADGSPDEGATYDLRNRQIAADLGYVFNKIHADE